MKRTTPTSSSNPATPPPTDAPARSPQNDSALTALSDAECDVHLQAAQLKAVLALVEKAAPCIDELESEDVRLIADMAGTIAKDLYASAMRVHGIAFALATGGAA